MSSVRQAWERQAQNWARWVRTPGHDWGERYIWPAFQPILPGPGDLTIDVGCGEGRSGRHLQELGHRVVGVDGAPTLARLAASHEQPLRVAVGDAARLPFASEVADLAVAFLSLQDVDDLEGTVAEIARVLRPGGRLCAAIVHPFSSAVKEGPEGLSSRGRYFEAWPVEERVERRGLAMIFHGHHRPLHEYVNALAGAGLFVERMVETTPDLDERWRALPEFLFFRAVRRR